MSTEKIRFAALRRVSTKQQEEEGESLDVQTANIEHAVEGMDDAEIVAWYGGAESATSGHAKPELDRLIADAEREPKLFDAVIVSRNDRWSRDNKTNEHGLDTFNENGIRFFVLTKEYDLDDLNDRFQLSIFALVGGYQAGIGAKASIDSKIKLGSEKVPSAGSLPFGRTFNKKTGDWSVDADKQRMVVDCAKRYLAGESIEKLAAEYGVHYSNLHKTLMQRSGTEWTITYKAKGKRKEDTVFTFTVPELLPLTVIKDLHTRAKDNRTLYLTGRTYFYLFARMIICEHCGYCLEGMHTKDGLLYYRHKPRTKKRDRPCPGPSRKCYVPAATLDSKAFRLLFEKLGNKAAVQKAIVDALPNNEEMERKSTRLEVVEEKLAQTEVNLQRGAAKVIKGLLTDDEAKVEMEKLRARKKSFEDEKRNLEQALRDAPSKELIVSKAQQAAEQFRKRLIWKDGVPIMLRTVKSIEYTDAKFRAKVRHASEQPMYNKEKRELLLEVFSGKALHPKLGKEFRHGVRIEWYDNGKKWRFNLVGHLIDTYGPSHKDGQATAVKAGKAKSGLVGAVLAGQIQID